MADEVRGAKPIVGDYSAASKASCRATVRLEDMADLKLLGLPNGFGFLPFHSIAAPAMSDTRQAADLDDEPGVPLDHQRHAVPAGDDVAVDRPLQYLLTLGDREMPERPSPLRQRVTAPDVVHQDVEPARFGMDPREELLHFGFDRVVGEYCTKPR